MVEAFLRKRAGDWVDVHSAGLESCEIHPLAREVMEEIGLPLTGHYPKRAREFLGKLSVGHLIVPCENTEANCPKLFPGATHRHFWSIPDPTAVRGGSEDTLAAFRRTRDRIREMVDAWVLGLSDSSPPRVRDRPPFRAWCAAQRSRLPLTIEFLHGRGVRRSKRSFGAALGQATGADLQPHPMEGAALDLAHALPA